MTIIAKFRADSVAQTADMQSVKLSAVTSGSDENEQWSKYTPAGAITMTISNPDAFGEIVEGAEYFVTINRGADTTPQPVDADPVESDTVE